MRLYLKLLLMVIVFVALARVPIRERLWDATFPVRMSIVLRYGTAAEYEALADENERVMAAEAGLMDRYLDMERRNHALGRVERIAANRHHHLERRREFEILRDQLRSGAA